MTERRVVLEGPCNFRDLGGLATDGGHSVRRGRLFRSDSLHHLTSADGPRLAELGIVTALDFRANNEVDRIGIGHLGELAIRHVHLPTARHLFDTVSSPEGRVLETAGAMYLDMLEKGGSAYAAAVRTLVEPGGLPAVFYCMAGKDRTGLFAAFVLGLLGVPDDEVVADYVISHDVLETLHARGRDQIAPEDVEKMMKVFSAVPREFGGAHAETMIDLLEGMQARYGSWKGYATEIGLSDGDVATLCESLTESVPSSEVVS
jgi:protein-tyrosine phosphatase